MMRSPSTSGATRTSSRGTSVPVTMARSTISRSARARPSPPASAGERTGITAGGRAAAGERARPQTQRLPATAVLASPRGSGRTRGRRPARGPPRRPSRARRGRERVSRPTLRVSIRFRLGRSAAGRTGPRKPPRSRPASGRSRAPRRNQARPPGARTAVRPGWLDYATRTGFTVEPFRLNFKGQNIGLYGIQR